MLPIRFNYLYFKVHFELNFLGGTTLHAFAGIGDGSGTVEHLCERATKLPLVAQKWRKCKHLIIDEISMVDGTFFEVWIKMKFSMLENML